MKLNLYVLVNDMDRAARFYQDVFQQSPVMQTPGYTAFQLNGALYGLFNSATYPVPAQWGNNCTPNILVDDIEAEHARIKAMNPVYLSDIQQNGPYRLFVFTDPDGTSIEFYAQS
jgi:predicted enzyme related to lactoylglutathione lyase